MHDVFFSTCSACPTYVPSAHGAYLLKARVLSSPPPLSPSSGEKTCMQAVLWLFFSFSHEGLFFSVQSVYVRLLLHLTSGDSWCKSIEQK